MAGGKPASIDLPALGRDAIAYIAQNPTSRNEYAIARLERSMYISKDQGRAWEQIAERGTALPARNR